MPTNPRNGTIVIFYDEIHSPYQIFIHPDNVLHVEWIMRHCAVLAVQVRQFSFRSDDYRFELLLDCKDANKPNDFIDRHISGPMKEKGYSVVTITQPHELHSLFETWKK